ncbi:uncharacterized protein LOC114800249 [Denticeps clupeoides]|uniref:uncharacterized protein LOC114800249 n=1 Tax=Denticeps clupeoides TaxID=299321 RepID=UPI0010A44EDF|nr:uncharacterized protein LOC114800249 [Denticeps clupeoides]
MDLICIDFLSLEPDSKNVCNVLVVTDHYTRYAQAFPTKDQKSSTVAKVLWEKFFIHYGLPRQVHSDQGRDFECHLIHDLLKMLGVKKSRTTPYHPQGDPQPERFNRTLLNMLGTLSTEDKSKWSQHISFLVHAYNCTVNHSTGYSPYFLMFGREARLPVDVCFGLGGGNSSPKSYLKYVSNMKKDLQAAYQLAESVAGKRNDANKQQYDQRVRYCPLAPGDRVLIRNVGLQGKHKLADRWSSTPYVIESQMPGLPVFKLKPEHRDGPKKVLHRNLILPIGQDVRLSAEETKVSAPKKRQSKRLKAKKATVPEVLEEESINNVDEGSDSEEDDMQVYTYQYSQPVTYGNSGERTEPFSLDLGIDQPAETFTLDPQHDESQSSWLSNQGPEESDNGPREPENGVIMDIRSECTAVIQENLTPGSEEMIEPEEESARPRRVRRAPERLTYDFPGQPTSVKLITHSVTPVSVNLSSVQSTMSLPNRYISTLFKWIG